MTDGPGGDAMAGDPGCLICRKQAGKEEAPPGGYIYEGRHFAVCHAPRSIGTAGTMIIESRRHFLDFGELDPAEGEDVTALLRSLFPAVRLATRAERVYSLAMMDEVPHFHLWLIPWKKDEPLRGVTYLASEHQLPSKEEVEQVVRSIKREFDSSESLRRPPGTASIHLQE